LRVTKAAVCGCYPLSPHVAVEGSESKGFLAILVQKCRFVSAVVNPGNMPYSHKLSV
jgi:hypothetical protein